MWVRVRNKDSVMGVSFPIIQFHMGAGLVAATCLGDAQSLVGHADQAVAVVSLVQSDHSHADGHGLLLGSKLVFALKAQFLCGAHGIFSIAVSENDGILRLAITLVTIEQTLIFVQD